MELEKISISGISDVYAVSAIKKEFKKAVNQPWKNSEPYPEYQKKLLADLAVLDILQQEIQLRGKKYRRFVLLYFSIVHILMEKKVC